MGEAGGGVGEEADLRGVGLVGSGEMGAGKRGFVGGNGGLEDIRRFLTWDRGRRPRLSCCGGKG